MKLLLIFLLSLFISLLITFFSKRLAIRFKIGSFPSARKIHKGFIPLLGGVGIFAGLLAGLISAFFFNLLTFDEILNAKYFFIGLLIVVVTGLLDDIKGLSSTQKFIGQFLAAVSLVIGGCVIGAFRSPDGTVLNLSWFAYPFSLLWIVFIINAVNLMDGLDGLAGGISLLALIGFLIIASINQDLFIVILAIASAGGILGFLKFNRYPASIFMGDVGSLLLGFLLAFFSIESLKIADSFHVYFLVSLVILGIPVTDTLISFFRRLASGEHPFKADQEHVHHRILNLGLTHSQTVDLIYVLAIFYTIIAVLMVIFAEVAGAPLFLIAFGFSLYWAWRLGYLETRSHMTYGLDEREASTAIRPQFYWNRVWHQIIVFLTDIIAVNIALYLTYWFKFQSGMFQALTLRSLQDYFAMPVFLIFTIGWIGLFWLNGLYNLKWDISRFDKSLRISKVITFGVILLGLITTDLSQLFTQSQISTLVFYWVVMIMLVNGFRLFVIMVEKRFHLFEYSLINTLIIGATRKARNVVREIISNPHLLYNIVGIVERKKSLTQFEGIPILGAYAELPDIISRYRVEEIIVALGKASRQDLMNIIGICDRMQVVVKTLPELNEIVTGKNANLAGHFLVRIFPERMVIWQWLVKRTLDLLFSIILVVCLSPLLMVISFLIKLKFKSSVFVKQPILGRNGEIFQMYLFRLTHSMQFDNGDYRNGINVNTLTKIGRIIYEKNLYKLPQLFNIFEGEMSVVGPRPESLEWYRENRNKFQFLHRRIMVRPGLTGLAQVKYRYESSQQFLSERIKYDIFYTENISINLDIRIILRSILLFLFRYKKKK